MPHFRKKPILVEAEQWFYGRIVKGVVEVIPPYPGEHSGLARVLTKQKQVVTLHEGEWVIMESDGIHAYPCSDEEFNKIYEPTV